MIESSTKDRRAPRRGFTLLELLVVVAILAILSGALVAAYEGLENKASEGVASFNIGALDKSIREYAVTNGTLFPNDCDSLLFSATGAGTDATALNVMNYDKLQKRLGPYALTATDVGALQGIGITSLRYVSGGISGKTYSNNSTPSAFRFLSLGDGTGTQPLTPNRVFDDPTGEFGYGVSVSLSAGVKVCAIRTMAGGSGGFAGVQAFRDSAAPSDSGTLNELFGLPYNQSHLVIVVAIGNKSSIVQGFGGTLDARGRGAALSQAPYYNKVKPWEYGRFLACYYLGSAASGSGVSYIDKPRFLTCLDGRGGCLDEENAEWRGTQD